MARFTPNISIQKKLKIQFNKGQAAVYYIL